MNLKKQFLFVKKIESFYKSGKPLAETFEMLSKNEKNIFLKKAFSNIYEEIKVGSSLTAAIKKQDDLLDDVYVKLIGVGEKSGKLDKILEQILQLQEAIISNRRKIIAVSIYPVAISLVFIFIFAIFLLGLIPALSDFMLKNNFEPPLFLLAISSVRNAICSPICICCTMPITFGIFYLLYYIYTNVEVLGLFRSRFLLFIPGFGRLEKFKNFFSFFFTLKICYDAGLAPIESLELSVCNVDNHHIFNKLRKTPDDVKEGSSIADSLMKTSTFEFDIIDLIRVGEETGKLDESYKEIIKLIEDKIKITIAVMLAMVKPMGIVLGLLFLIGVFVLIFIIIFSVLSKIQTILPQ